MKISSLNTRLVAGVALLALAAVIAVAGAARHGTRTAFIQFREREQEHAQRLAETHRRLREALDGRCCAGDVLSLAGREMPPGTGFVVVGMELADVLAFGGQAFDGVTAVRVQRRDSGLALVVDRQATAGVARMTVGVGHNGAPVRLADGREAQVYAVYLPTVEELRRVNAFYGSLDRRLLAATSLVGLAIVGFAWIMGRRIVKPVVALSEAARALGRGDLARRVPADGSDEIAELARSFNAMAAELERQETLRRHMVNDITHELRTPLTALRCRLESVIDGLAPNPERAVRDLHDEVLHLGRLVEDLHELSIAEARDIRLVIETVALLPIVRSAARAAGLEGDARLRIDVDPDLRARADTIRVRQILLNLLTNAARHTPPAGTITVTGEVSGAEVVIRVANTGSTLNAEERRRVFDRFYRTDPARQRSTGGAGLGLAIVKTLAQALDGRVWVESTADGVRFGVALPGPT